jgi:hypothetical protein
VRGIKAGLWVGSYAAPRSGNGSWSDLGLRCLLQGGLAEASRFVASSWTSDHPGGAPTLSMLFVLACRFGCCHHRYKIILEARQSQVLRTVFTACHFVEIIDHQFVDAVLASHRVHRQSPF